jgi:ribose 5-phosphate isomerase RpiB
VNKALAIVQKWLFTPFAGGRHEHRVEKIAAIEKEAAKA